MPVRILAREYNSDVLQEPWPLRLFVQILLFIMSWNAGLWAGLENTSVVPSWHLALTNGIFVPASAAPGAVEGLCLEKGARVKWLSCVEQMQQVEEENFSPGHFW